MVCSLNLKNDNWVVSVILFYMNYVVLLKWQDKLGNVVLYVLFNWCSCYVYRLWFRKKINIGSVNVDLDNHFLEWEVSEEWRLWKVWLLSKS